MRISFNGRYDGLSYYQQGLMTGMQSTLDKMSTGLNIKHGYQDSTAFNKTLILDNSLTNLEQTLSLAKTANTFTLHTDSSINTMRELMIKFNTKMVQALNDSNSSTSLQALRNDLRSIRDNILSVANTAVGGEYLFAGSALKRKPFGSDGTYLGNNQQLEAVLGNKNKLSYNITGSELFLGMNRDHYKEIVSNVKHYNQSMLHPGIMDKKNETELSKEVYLKATDTLRDLVGDDDNDTTNNLPEVFYIQGVRADGTSFKAKFQLDINYSDQVDKKDATKVQDLLDKIGEAYGNTTTNKVVDVSLNEYGQINIKDLTHGRSNLDFYMVSSNRRDFVVGDQNNNPNQMLDNVQNGQPLQFSTNPQGGNFTGPATFDPNTGKYNVTIGNNTVPITYEKDNVFSYTNPTTGKKEKMYSFNQAGTITPPVSWSNGVDDINTLTKYGDRITTYIQSNFLGEKNQDRISSIADQSDHRRHTIATTFRTGDNVLADAKTKLIDVLGDKALEELRAGRNVTINFAGTTANTNATPPLAGGAVAANSTLVINPQNMSTLTVQDFMSSLENSYGGNDRVGVEIHNGKITLIDKHVEQSLKNQLPSNRDIPFDGPSSLNVVINVTSNNQPLNVFANDYTLEYDRVQFTPNGSTLTGNVPQIINSNNEYATGDTKLSEVAGSSLKDTKYTLNYKDIDGITRKAVIHLFGDNPTNEAGNLIDANNPGPGGSTNADDFRNKVFIEIPDTRQGAAAGATITIPLYRPLDNNSMTPPNGVAVESIPPDEMTYKQLSDALTVALNASRNDTDQYAIITDANATLQQKKDAYEHLLVNANVNLNVGVNQHGQLQIKDNTRSPSLMNISLSETQRHVSYLNTAGNQQTYVVKGSGDYSNIPPNNNLGQDIEGNDLQPPASTIPYREGSALTFHSNNALVLDDPHVNIFQKLDEAIKAVDLEIYRAGDLPEGAYNDSLRSVGMQGTKQWVEHIEEQVNKVRSKAGSQGNAFTYEQERAETLIVQTKTMRSNTIDADIPATYASFVQLTMNYQALLSATSKINALSLVNYI